MCSNYCELKYNETHFVAIRVVISGRGERIPLFVIQILLEIEEGVEEYRCQLTPFHVGQRYFSRYGWLNHVEHLQFGENLLLLYLFQIIFCGKSCLEV